MKVFSEQTFQLPITIGTQSENASRFGQLYAISTGPITVISNSFLGVQLSNPSDSTSPTSILRVSGGATASTTIELVKNGSFASAGTAMTIFNLNFASADTSTNSAKFITSITDPFNSAPFSSLIQSGGSLVIDYNGGIKLSPGTSLGIRIMNTSLTSVLLSIDTSWWEG